MVSYIQEVLETVERRNPGESEFLQAVREVLDTLEPVIERTPAYSDAKVLDRLVEQLVGGGSQRLVDRAAGPVEERAPDLACPQMALVDQPAKQGLHRARGPTVLAFGVGRDIQSERASANSRVLHHPSR